MQVTVVGLTAHSAASQCERGAAQRHTDESKVQIRGDFDDRKHQFLPLDVDPPDVASCCRGDQGGWSEV